jgi:hypothetical protein
MKQEALTTDIHSPELNSSKVCGTRAKSGSTASALSSRPPSPPENAPGVFGPARIAMLADLYNWFSEGFDTADLKDAKTLLDELAG